MSQKNEIEADKPSQTTDFLPSDGASCCASLEWIEAKNADVHRSGWRAKAGSVSYEIDRWRVPQETWVCIYNPGTGSGDLKHIGESPTKDEAMKRCEIHWHNA